MPGDRFSSQAVAEDMRLTRQVNVVTGGMGQVNYVVRRCVCASYHVMTEAHLEKWEAARRAKRQEKKRNA